VHNLRNAMLALAVAREAGVSLADAAERHRGHAGQPSMRTAWETLGRARSSTTPTTRTRRRCAPRSSSWPPSAAGGSASRCSATMRELGAHTEPLHHDVARAALAAKVEVVAGVGLFADALLRVAPGRRAVVTAPDVDELWPLLEPRLTADAVILLKASRGVRLERLVPHLSDWASRTCSPS
jgi:UDP-N-acetylmuramoyl-tripeptide--D-alanyl-D-alanine ligase